MADPSDDAVERLRISYEQLAYGSLPFRASHPDSMAVAALLGGLTPPAVEQCRLLEVGCASGGNVLPMAVTLPASRFVAIDLSPAQIDAARRTAEDAGLANVEFHCGDLRRFEPDGTFDYVVAHGFYSWVTRDTRERLLALIARHLVPNGVAYISYNTLPGWHVRRMMRDMMMYHARSAASEMQKLALAAEMLDLVRHNVGNDPLSAAIRILCQQTLAKRDYSLAHDDLEVVNDPVYFHEFVSHAASHGLAILGAADPREPGLAQLPAPAQHRLQAMQLSDVEREQYVDFFLNRAHRQTLLCHGSEKRTVSIDSLPVAALHAAAPKVDDRVRQGGTGPGGWAVLRRLAQSWPGSLRCADLVNTYRSEAAGSEPPLPQFLLAAAGEGLIELWPRAASFVGVAGNQPLATPLARVQARTGQPVTNLRHEAYDLAPDIRNVLCLLDGSRDRTQLAVALADLASRGEFTVRGSKRSRDVIGSASGEILNHLERHSFLMSLVQVR